MAICWKIRGYLNTRREIGSENFRLRTISRKDEKINKGFFIAINMARKRTEEKLQDEKYLIVAKRLQENLNVLRNYHGLTYEELSNRTGYSANYLHDIFIRDAGNKTPSLDLLVKLAEVFETSPGKLLDIDLEINKRIKEKFLKK